MCEPIPRQVPTTLEIERRASVEEMLTDIEKNSVKVLQPKIMTPGEIEEQKLEAQAKEHIEKANAKNPYDNESILNQLLVDMKNLEEKISQKIQFDSMWREMNQIVEKAEKKPISIARCYPMKNRVPDVLPFDNSRYAQCSKIRKKMQFQKYKNTFFFTISKMAKNQIFAPQKSLKLPKMQF